MYKKKLYKVVAERIHRQLTCEVTLFDDLKKIAERQKGEQNGRTN